jgi:hypothetical protein
MASEYMSNFAAITLTAGKTLDEYYAGKRIALSAAAAQTIVLPHATGSGAVYEFIVITSITSNESVIKVGRAADTFIGTATLYADGGDTVVGFAAGATADTLEMNGTTKGGLAGARATFTDIAANLWHVDYISDASSTEATPFDATVS